MLLNEYQFTFLAGPTTQVFRIEELVWGIVGWPQRCRLKLPTTSDWEARTFYGRTCLEVADKVTHFLRTHYATKKGQHRNAFCAAGS